MSYWYCGGSLTNDQKDRIAATYDAYWSDKYDNTPINLNGKVNLMCSNTPLPNVAIQWRHTADPTRYSNTFTDNNGNFRGILYDNTVKATVKKLGSGFETIFIPPPVRETYYEDVYTDDDWADGVTIFDEFLVRKHILGIEVLNGYGMLAADVNHSNNITANDAVFIRRMVLGIIKKFPNYDAPWRFIPDYIPDNFQFHFNENPFNMSPVGIPAGTTYTEPDWEYQASSSAGYDAVHLGNLNNCNGMLACESGADVSFTNQLFDNNQIVSMDIKADNFSDILAFQTGFFVDHDKIQILDVTPGLLPDFSREDNVGLSDIESNKLRLSWLRNDAMPQDLPAGSTLFTIVFQTKQAITNISSAIHLDDSALKTTFFREDDCEEAIRLTGQTTILANRGGNASGRMATTSSNSIVCMPNPSFDQFKVAVESNSIEKMEGTLILSDINGRPIYSMDILINNGVNVYNLDKSLIAPLNSGMFIVSVITNDFSLSSKIIIN